MVDSVENHKSLPDKEFILFPNSDFIVAETAKDTIDVDVDMDHTAGVETNDDTNSATVSNCSSEEIEVIQKKLELCDQKMYELQTQLQNINNMSMLQLIWNRVWKKI